MLQGSFDLFGLGHFGPDAANGGVQAGADDDATSLASGDVGAGENQVFLVLIDGTGIGHGFVVLDDRHGFTGQDGLIDAEGGGHDGNDPNISGDLVTDCNLDEEKNS